jgi:hypothetical protein
MFGLEYNAGPGVPSLLEHRRAMIALETLQTQLRQNPTHFQQTLSREELRRIDQDYIRLKKNLVGRI